MLSRKQPVTISVQRTLKLSVRALAILACSLAIACGGANSALIGQQQPLPAGLGQPATPLSGFALPSPSQLLAQMGGPTARQAAYIEADFAKTGMQNAMPPAPRNRIKGNGENVVFQPQWAPEVGMSLDGLAYCLYHFVIPGYDRNPQIRYTWVSQPDVRSCWVLLANWNNEHWDVFPAESDRKLDLPSIAPYFDASGNLFVAIICTGTKPISLHQVRVGSELPFVDFTASPKRGMMPLTTHLDPASCDDPDGVIVNYEWDFNGDGVFDESYDTKQAIDHLYDSGETYSVTLRCTDDDGLTAQRTLPLDVAAPWVHTWGGAAAEQIAKVLADPAGNIYALGHARSFGADVDALLLLKYNSQGQLQWARTYSGGVADYGEDLFYDGPSGYLYITGRTESYGAGGADVLVQKWDTDGNVVWSRTWGGSGDDRGHGVSFGSGTVIIAGETASYGKGAADLLFLGYAPDGTLGFCVDWGGNAADVARSIVPKELHSDLSLFAVAGETASYGGGSTDAMYAEVYSDGMIYRVDTLGGSAAEYGTAVLCDATHNSYVTGYRHDASSGDDVLLLVRDTAGASTLQKAWNFTGDERGLGLARDALGNLFVAGSSLSSGTQSDGLLLAFSAEGAVLVSQRWDRLDDDGQLSSVNLHPYGGLLLGGYGSGVPDGAWASAEGTLSDVGGSWSSVENRAGTPAGFTETQPAEAAVDITTGTQDSGGGGNDGLTMLQVVPLS